MSKRTIELTEELCSLACERDITSLIEQLHKFKTLIIPTSTLDEIKEIFDSQDFVINFDNIKQLLADCVDARIKVESDKDAYDSIAGLIYTKQISKTLALKLETMGIKSLKDFSKLTFDEVKNARNDKRQSNQRCIGSKAMVELFELLISHNLSFKDKTTEQLSEMLKGYKEFTL